MVTKSFERQQDGRNNHKTGNAEEGWSNNGTKGSEKCKKEDIWNKGEIGIRIG